MAADDAGTAGTRSRGRSAGSRTAEDAARSATSAASDAAGAAADAARSMSEEFRSATGSATAHMNENVEATVARIRELNERALAAARAAGSASLDAYEKALQSFVSVEERLAEASQLDWVKAIVGAQAEFVQNISGVYVNAAREMLDPTKRA